MTQEQYDRGWELISTGHTTSQILAATGMTRPQLDHVTKSGWKGKPAYVVRLATISATVRKRAQDAADEISIGALDAIKRDIQLTKGAASLAAMLIQAHVQHVVIPAQQRLQAGTLSPEEARKTVESLAPPPQIQGALRTLREYVSLDRTARMYRAVFDSDLVLGADTQDRAASVRLDLGAEKALSAAFAVVEDVVDHTTAATTDPLDLLPEWAGWSLAEIEEYTASGRMPDRVYQDGRDGVELPDECMDVPFEG